MSLIQQFARYAAAFERAYETDQWSEVEALLAPNAVYEIGLPILGAERCSGRDEVIDWFKRTLDDFDRRFESRELALIEGPKERNGEVWVSGTATYQATGFPSFVLELEETIRFEDGLLVRLEDRYSPAMKADTEAYFERYGEALGLVGRGASA